MNILCTDLNSGSCKSLLQFNKQLIAYVNITNTGVGFRGFDDIAMLPSDEVFLDAYDLLFQINIFPPFVGCS